MVSVGSSSAGGARAQPLTGGRWYPGCKGELVEPRSQQKNRRTSMLSRFALVSRWLDLVDAEDVPPTAAATATPRTVEPARFPWSAAPGLTVASGLPTA